MIYHTCITCTNDGLLMLYVARKSQCTGANAVGGASTASHKRKTTNSSATQNSKIPVAKAGKSMTAKDFDKIHQKNFYKSVFVLCVFVFVFVLCVCVINMYIKSVATYKIYIIIHTIYSQVTVHSLLSPQETTIVICHSVKQ